MKYTIKERYTGAPVIIYTDNLEAARYQARLLCGDATPGKFGIFDELEYPVEFMPPYPQHEPTDNMTQTDIYLNLK